MFGNPENACSFGFGPKAGHGRHFVAISWGNARRTRGFRREPDGAGPMWTENRIPLIRAKYRMLHLFSLSALIWVEVTARMASPKAGSGRLAPGSRLCGTEHNGGFGPSGLIPNPASLDHY